MTDRATRGGRLKKSHRTRRCRASKNSKWLDHPPARLERGREGAEISQLWHASTRLGPPSVDSLSVSAESA